MEVRKPVVVYAHVAWEASRGLWSAPTRPRQILQGAAGSIREVRRQVARSKVRIQDLVPREVGLQGKWQREGSSWGLW